MLQKFLIGILILLLARFLDKVSAQYLYFLAREHELLNANDLLIIKTSSFYALKGFWNIFWWFLFVTSTVFSIGYMLTNRSLGDEFSDSEPEEEEDDDDDDSTKTTSSKSKPPTRASRRYKSKRYRA